MKTKKETRGGSRKNAGAKPKYNEQTKTIAFRCPVSKIRFIKDLIRLELLKFEP
jgi:hypothetical protein